MGRPPRNAEAGSKRAPRRPRDGGGGKIQPQAQQEAASEAIRVRTGPGFAAAHARHTNWLQPSHGGVAKNSGDKLVHAGPAVAQCACHMQQDLATFDVFVVNVSVSAVYAQHGIALSVSLLQFPGLLVPVPAVAVADAVSRGLDSLGMLCVHVNAGKSCVVPLAFDAAELATATATVMLLEVEGEDTALAGMLGLSHLPLTPAAIQVLTTGAAPQAPAVHRARHRVTNLVGQLVGFVDLVTRFTRVSPALAPHLMATAYTPPPTVLPQPALHTVCRSAGGRPGLPPPTIIVADSHLDGSDAELPADAAADAAAAAAPGTSEGGAGAAAATPATSTPGLGVSAGAGPHPCNPGALIAPGPTAPVHSAVDVDSPGALYIGGTTGSSNAGPRYRSQGAATTALTPVLAHTVLVHAYSHLGGPLSADSTADTAATQQACWNDHVEDGSSYPPALLFHNTPSDNGCVVGDRGRARPLAILPPREQPLQPTHEPPTPVPQHAAPVLQMRGSHTLSRSGAGLPVASLVQGLLDNLPEDPHDRARCATGGRRTPSPLPLLPPPLLPRHPRRASRWVSRTICLPAVLGSRHLCAARTL